MSFTVYWYLIYGRSTVDGSFCMAFDWYVVGEVPNLESDSCMPIVFI